ncbi:MAG: aminopeptidase P family protein [Clostridia bacterium]|nr:aminopeptidase P family protein [Clostridia bacterium]
MHAEKIQKTLAPHEAALCLTVPACRYLTGFDYEDGGVLLTVDTAYLLTDSRYIEAARESVQGMQCVSCNGLLKTVEMLLDDNGIQKLYIEQSVSLTEFYRLQELAVEVVADDTLEKALADARLIKDAQEIALLKQAQTITEKGFEHILPYIKAGVTEKQVALELEFFMRQNGADGVSFPFIVVSGANTSRPHGVPTDKPIVNGDFVTMDFGALCHGYHADMTRTVAVGEITDIQRNVYETVLRAQQTALGGIRAGISGKTADAFARDVIQAAGYGAHFGHGTGHGVGVEIHEAPRLSPLAPDTPLQVGTVVTVEPGIYLEGQFGVRIEDMVVVTENGNENLTKANKKLIIL